MIYFLKNSLWDMLICTVLVFACATCIFSGFYVPEDQVTSYAVTAGASAVLVVLMTIASYDKRSIIVGLAALVLIFAAMIIVSAAGGNNVFADDEGNPFLRFLLLILTGVVLFAASRFRIGTVLLIPAGTIVLCMIEFMYDSWHIICLLLFLIAGVMMVIYRNYIFNVLHSRTLKTAQTSAVAYALVLCLLVTGIGGGIFYGIIGPMHPPAKELKIITKYLSLEVLEKIGVADIETINDPDMTTDQLDENRDTTQQDTEDKDENLNQDVSQAENENADDGTSQDQMDKRRSGPFQAIRYDWGIPLWVLAVILAILLIAAVIGFRIWLRRRWFSKVRSKTPEEQVREMYQFFLRKFRQMKIRPVKGETPSEFAGRNALRMQPFRTAAGLESADFMSLTEILVRTEYGGYRPGPADLKQFESFYRSFYRNCRQYLGKVQYMIKFFIL